MKEECKSILIGIVVGIAISVLGLVIIAIF